MIDESWYRRPAGMPEHLAAGGAVVRKEGDRVLVAVVSEDGLSDYILPKGHVEAGESLEQAARREIEEEAGLRDLRLLGELGVCERMNFPRTGWKKTHYFIFTTDQVEGRPTDANHAYATTWVPLDELGSLFWPEQRELLEENRERIRALLAG